MSETIIVELLIALVLFFAMMLVADKVTPTKSKLYRQDLSNMYVAGKIKQIAKKEGLDLDSEFLEFAKITKNKKIDFEYLDNTVERELQEKLTVKKQDETTDKE